MRRSILHLTAVLVAIGALSSALGSAAPPYQASASEPPTGLTAAIPEITLGPRPDRVPVSTPTPVPSPVRTVTPLPTRMPRPAATLRPLPVPVIAAQEVTLVNLDTGRFLWQSNARAARAPASLTKIFTAMVAVDLIGMNTTVTVPASITQLPADSTFMGLTPGERLTVRELLYGVFLNSGNDAAETLAASGTSRSTFIAAMNTKAAHLGLHGTHFTNPTGLDASGHYSSAFDLALAATYLESHYSALVAIAEFHELAPDPGRIHGDVSLAILLSALIGSISFSGSLIAFAKLQELIQGRPIVYPGQKAGNALLFLACAGVGAAVLGGSDM